MNETRDALASLLDHPGWHLFCEMVRAECGDGRRYEQALMSLSESPSDPAAIVGKMQQIAVARREILRLLEWPKKEAAKPDATSAVSITLTEFPALSRRGGL